MSNVLIQFGDGKVGIPDAKNQDIGFLVYSKEAHVMKTLKVGTRLKNPSFPIWLICSNDNWGVIFSPNADLLNQFTKEYGHKRVVYNVNYIHV